MSQKMHRNQIDRKSKKRDAKKKAVLQTSKGGLMPKAILFGAVLALLVGGYFYLGPKEQAATAPSGTVPTELMTHIRYPASDFADGKARHFSYKTDGLTIRYFILKSADGVIRAAFDACDVCWPAGKGYYQEGDQMICRNCGRRFASIRINEVKGGCNPAPLQRRIEGDSLVLKVSDILQGRQYFDFEGRV